MASHGILFNHTTANKNEYLNPCIPMGYRCYRDIYLIDCISKNGRLQVLVLCEVRISLAQVATFHYDCYPKDTLSSAGECCVNIIVSPLHSKRVYVPDSWLIATGKLYELLYTTQEK